MCINIYKLHAKKEMRKRFAWKRTQLMNTRNENSYLMVIAIIRNSVNVNAKKMSRVTLLNMKSYIHCCFTKALYHALEFFTLPTRSSLIHWHIQRRNVNILIWYICPITIRIKVILTQTLDMLIFSILIYIVPFTHGM